MPCVEFCRMRGRIHQNAPESILSAFFAHFSARILRYSAVCGALPLRDAHVIAEAVHHELERDYPDVKHCTVHVNPA